MSHKSPGRISPKEKDVPKVISSNLRDKVFFFEKIFWGARDDNPQSSTTCDELDFAAEAYASRPSVRHEAFVSGEESKSEKEAPETNEHFEASSIVLDIEKKIEERKVKAGRDSSSPEHEWLKRQRKDSSFATEIEKRLEKHRQEVELKISPSPQKEWHILKSTPSQSRDPSPSRYYWSKSEEAYFEDGLKRSSEESQSPHRKVLVRQIMEKDKSQILEHERKPREGISEVWISGSEGLSAEKNISIKVMPEGEHPSDFGNLREKVLRKDEDYSPWKARSRTPSVERILEEKEELDSCHKSDANLSEEASQTQTLDQENKGREVRKFLLKKTVEENANHAEYSKYLLKSRSASRDSLLSSASGDDSIGKDWYPCWAQKVIFDDEDECVTFQERFYKYQAHISSMKDEQERVQKKTFLNWINAHLSRHDPPMKLDDLIEDLKDGTRLLALLTVLSGEKLPVERGRVLRRPHFLSNANTALQFLQSRRIKLVNINSTDLVDGRPSVVLGLIWTIILYFQIEENTRQLEKLGQLMEDHSWSGSSGRGESPSKGMSGGISRERPSVTRRSAAAERWKMGAKKALLEWVRQIITKRFGIVVNDFGTSWRNGNAFLALIHCINPRLVNLQSMSNATNKARLDLAFRLAERDLGIARLLDSEDVDVDKPDEKSIMTYVAQFLNKYPEPGISPVQPACMSPTTVATSSDMLSEVEMEYGELTTWLNNTSTWLSTLQDPATHGNINYERFKTLRSESEEKRILYDRLKCLVESHSSMVGITNDSWRAIVQSWKKVNEQLSNWAWLLDAFLPGSLGLIGEWLKRAEIILGTEEKQIGKPDELANILGKKIEEHKIFFSKTQSMIVAFEKAKVSPEASTVSPQIVEYIQSRLTTVRPRAAQRKLRLQYLEHKYCLVAFLILVEAKLKTWAIKYGKELEVQKILDQYRNFVSEKNLFKEYERAFKEMQQVSEAYRKDTFLSKTESDAIAKFLVETNERWRNISVELRCIQSLLEEVISYWKKFGELTSHLEEWLERAFAMTQMSEEDKMDFFQDLSDWKEKHSQMNETGNFLSATCRIEVTQEIRERIIFINSKWEQLFQYVEQYLHRGQIIRTQNDYKEGEEQLEEWIGKAQQILHTTCICTVNSIKSYAEQLKKLSQEIEVMEVLFKNVSKSFQALVQELAPNEIERMMRSLKQDKEQLVRVRASIPQKMYLATQVVTQLEAVDAGVTEINKWLDEAEGLLDNFSLQGSKETIQGQLDKHRVFFSRQLYFKSMLETKNRIYQSLLKTSNGGEYLDMVCLQEEIKRVNKRLNIFDICIHHLKIVK